MKKELGYAAMGGLIAITLLGAGGQLALRDDGIQFPDGTVQTTAAQGTEQLYYLTDSTWDGASVLAACAEGFHTASLWEVLDPSRLLYDSQNPDAATNADAGMGPPAKMNGWSRTGRSSSTDGIASNCDSWISNSAEDFGQTASLEITNPLDENARMILIWNSQLQACNSSSRVWCIEDQGVSLTQWDLGS